MSTPSNAESQGGTMKNVTSGGSSSGQQGTNQPSGQTGSTGHQQGGSSGHSGNQQGRSAGLGGAASSTASGGKDHLATK